MGTKNSVMKGIRAAGGEVLNKDFIVHRTMRDVMDTIKKAAPEELAYRDEHNRSLLHCAAATFDGLPVVELLIEKGLDPDLVDNKGKKPAHYAKHPGVLISLVAHSAKQTVKMQFMKSCM